MMDDSQVVTKALEAAINSLERITYRETSGHERHNGYLNWVNLNDPETGNVQNTLDQLRTALAAMQPPIDDGIPF